MKHQANEGILSVSMTRSLNISSSFNPPRDLSLEKDYPTRTDDREELTTIAEDTENDDYSDGIEYDSRSEPDSQPDFEFPPEDDSDVDEDEGGDEDSDDEIAMSDAEEVFTLPLR